MRDRLKFSDFVHSQKRHPGTGMRVAIVSPKGLGLDGRGFKSIVKGASMQYDRCPLCYERSDRLVSFIFKALLSLKCPILGNS